MWGPSAVVFIAGWRRGCDNGSWRRYRVKRTRRGRWTGNCTCWMAASCGRINTRQGQKSEPSREALGCSRGGVATTIHVRVDGHGPPITFLLTPGEAHESTQAQALLEQGTIRVRQRGREPTVPNVWWLIKPMVHGLFEAWYGGVVFAPPYRAKAMSAAVAPLTRPFIVNATTWSAFSTASSSLDASPLGTKNGRLTMPLCSRLL